VLTGHEEREPEGEDEEQDGPLLPLLREVPQRVRPLRATRPVHRRKLHRPAADGGVREEAAAGLVLFWGGAAPARRFFFPRREVPEVFFFFVSLLYVVF
jgi:hypothetical protein